MSVFSRIGWLVLVCQILTLSTTPLYASPRGDHGFEQGAPYFVQRPVVCVRGQVNPGCVAPVRKTLRAGAGAVGFVARVGARGVGVAARVGVRSVAWAGLAAFRTAGFAARVVGGAARFLLFGRVFR